MFQPDNSGKQVIPPGARQHLDRALASPLFVRSPRQSGFLRFVVEKVLAGEPEQIKEYEIAVHVYGRRADHSTQADPIVRVEAARLRSKLQQYYATDGLREEFRIEMPKGAYVPEFVPAPGPMAITREETGPIDRVGVPGETSQPLSLKSLHPIWWGVAALAIVAAGSAWMFSNRVTGSPLLPPHTKIPSSIVVMPFSDASVAHHGERLASGVTEALIAELRQSNTPNFHVRTTVIKGSAGVPHADADAVFTGAVSMNDGIVRVTGSLEHQASKTVLWNGSVESNFGDRPESEYGLLFENIAFLIAQKQGIALMERQEEEFALAYAPRVEARRAWLEADVLWRRGDADSVRKSIELLKKAKALDPNFAWVRATLAFAYARAVELGFTPEAGYRRWAHEESAQALALAPYLATAHAAAIRISLVLDRNLQAASATCVSALNKLSGSYSIRDQCAEVYSLDRRNDAAAELELRSVRRNEKKAIPLAELALIRYRSRKFDEARSVADQALSLDRNYLPARRIHALAQMLDGHPEKALAFMRGGAVDPTGQLAALSATALTLMGDKEGAMVELRQAERQLARPDRTDLIRPYLALGLTARAKTVMDEASLQQNSNLLQLLVDPQVVDMTAKIH